MDPAAYYYDRLSAFRLALMPLGFDLRQAEAAVTTPGPHPVLIQLPRPIIGEQCIVALPDAHLSDGKGGDVFRDGTPANAARLLAMLRALSVFVRADPLHVTLLQLGDWYDVWRDIGHDTTESQYSAIDAAYLEIANLDKQLGLAHCIGNHDASFTHALPDRRVADGLRFRFGFGLGGTRGRIFAMHGHQADRIEGEPNAPLDQIAVWLGSLAARFVSSEFRNLQELIDKRGTEGALIWAGGLAAEQALSQLPGGLAPVKGWLKNLLGKAREDVPPAPRAPLGRPDDGQAWYANFVRRESRGRLVRIAAAATEKIYGSAGNELELLLVGHSHKACVSWTPHPKSGKPVVVVDAGSLVYGQAQLLFAAGNTVGVYDVVKIP